MTSEMYILENSEELLWGFSYFINRFVALCDKM